MLFMLRARLQAWRSKPGPQRLRAPRAGISSATSRRSYPTVRTMVPTLSFGIRDFTPHTGNMAVPSTVMV